MSAKKRILFIANEMSPYLELTEFSEIVKQTGYKANDSNFEVRCIMPPLRHYQWTVHRLHGGYLLVSMFRLIIYPSIKWLLTQRQVAGLFPDNEELFARNFLHENENWFEDNGPENGVFVKEPWKQLKFGWPDIIHCSGWMRLIPIS